jgi:3'(2'), 5'-bisphosphate nucleotidase
MAEPNILQVARICGWAAARLCREVRALADQPDALYKDSREPVTLADYGSQAVILEEISRTFPGHAVIAEEGAAQLREEADERLRKILRRIVGEILARPVDFEQVCDWIDHRGDSGSEYTWVIDPIDGTKGFLRGDQYAVAIGVLRDGEPWAGVLACPNLPLPSDGEGQAGALFVAARGEGVIRAALDSDLEEKVTVSVTESANEVRVLGSVESAHGDPAMLTGLVDELGLGGGIVRIDSQAKYATVAAGDAEIYLRPQSRPDYREKVWDHAAGVVVVEEAGGRVTDLEGNTLDFRRGERLEGNRGVVATNGAVHDRVLEALARL